MWTLNRDIKVIKKTKQTMDKKENFLETNNIKKYEKKEDF